MALNFSASVGWFMSFHGSRSGFIPAAHMWPSDEYMRYALPLAPMFGYGRFDPSVKCSSADTSSQVPIICARMLLTLSWSGWVAILETNCREYAKTFSWLL